MQRTRRVLLLFLVGLAVAAGVPRRDRQRRGLQVGADGHVTGVEDRMARGLFTPQEAREAARMRRRRRAQEAAAAGAGAGAGATPEPSAVPPPPAEVQQMPAVQEEPNLAVDPVPELASEDPVDPPEVLEGSAEPLLDADDAEACSEGCRVVRRLQLQGVEEYFLEDMAVDAAREVAYVSWVSATNGSVSRYSLKDNALLPPLTELPLDYPTDLAVGPEGELYVLEAGKIRAFDGKTGAVRGEWGPLQQAAGLAVLPTAEGTWVYTIDGGQIKGFRATGGNATAAAVVLRPCWLEKQGSLSLAYDAEVCVEDPVDLAITFDVSGGVAGTESPAPTIWVLDQGAHTLELFDLAGKRVGTVNDPTAQAGDDGSVFVTGVKLAADPWRGLAYVVDTKSMEVVSVDRRGQVWHRVGALEDRCGYHTQQRLFGSTTLLGVAPEAQEFPEGGEVGVEIQLDRPGSLTSVRFYRAAGEPGGHTATIWDTAAGRAVATVDFPVVAFSEEEEQGEGEEEGAGAAVVDGGDGDDDDDVVDEKGEEGWETVYLDTPLALEAGVAYVVSVNVNAEATGLIPAAEVIDTGKGLRTAGAAGGRVGAAVGEFPSEPAPGGVHFVDVGVEMEPFQTTILSAVTVAAVYDPARAAAGDAVLYVNHVEDTTSEQVVGLKCSGYPPFMADCGHHLAGLDASLVEGVREALDGRSVLGFSFWGGKYALEPDLDYLGEAALLAEEVGVDAIGLWMGGEVPPSELYPFNSPDWPTAEAAASVASLTELAQLPYYQELFEDPAIKTYVINANAISTLGVGIKLRFGTYSEADAASDRAEFGNFTQYLAETYAGTGKTFILQAWSLDTFLGNTARTEVVPEWAARAASWLNARQAGVEAGRAAAAEEPASVAIYHAVQVSRGVLAKSRGETTPWAVDRVLPLITTDLVSWAAFEASRKKDTALLQQGIAALDKAVRRSAQGYQLDGLDYPLDPQAKAPIRVFISEIGEPDQRLKGEPEASKALLPGAIKAALEANVPLILYWAAYNGEITPSSSSSSSSAARPWTESHVGSWLKRPDGTPSFAYCYLQAVTGVLEEEVVVTADVPQ